MAVKTGALLEKGEENIVRRLTGLGTHYEYLALGVGNNSQDATRSDNALLGSSQAWKDATRNVSENANSSWLAIWEATFTSADYSNPIVEFGVAQNASNGTVNGFCRFTMDAVTLGSGDEILIRVIASPQSA